MKLIDRQKNTTKVSKELLECNDVMKSIHLFRNLINSPHLYFLRNCTLGVPRVGPGAEYTLYGGTVIIGVIESKNLHLSNMERF